EHARPRPGPTRISGAAAGAPPRGEPPHPFAPGGGCSCKDRANEDIGTCCRSTASVRKPPAPFAPGGGCSCKDRANEEIGICCRSTASVRTATSIRTRGRVLLQ